MSEKKGGGWARWEWCGMSRVFGFEYIVYVRDKRKRMGEMGVVWYVWCVLV